MSTCVVQEEGRFISNVYRLSRVGLPDHQESPKTNCSTSYKIFQILHIGHGMDILSLLLCLLGLTNAPVVFMDLMNRVCKPHLDKFFIVIINDILIYSKSKEDHEAHLKLVLELRKKEKLFAKFSKCEFWLREVHFLGHLVSNNEIHMESSKIEAMKNCNVPKTPSEIRSFLGLAEGSEIRVRRGSRGIFLDIKGQFIVTDKILAAQGETSKERNETAEMMRGLDQQMEKREAGGLYFIDRG
nr:putative reverse transcriptase domain-containing protein [Tanacetum cinerariifolium]